MEDVPFAGSGLASESSEKVLWTAAHFLSSWKSRVCAGVSFGAQHRQRGLEPGGVDVHAGQFEPHLDAGEGSGERQVVEVAEVADPEHAPGELAQAGAQ